MKNTFSYNYCWSLCRNIGLSSVTFFLLHTTTPSFFVHAQTEELPTASGILPSYASDPSLPTFQETQQDTPEEQQLEDTDLFLTSTGESTVENGVFTARQNVELLYGKVSMYADEIIYDSHTRWARAFGNVRLFRGDGTLLVGQSMEYNTRTGEVRTGITRGVMLPFLFSTDQTVSSDAGTPPPPRRRQTQQPAPIEHTFSRAKLFFENIQNPSFRITARSVHHRPDINRTVFRNVTMYVGNIPVMWWPKLVYHPGRSDFALQVTPGYNSEWGAFLLLAYGLEVRPGLYARPRLDFRSAHGIAGGLETRWFHGQRRNTSLGQRGQGEFSFYLADDRSPTDPVEHSRPSPGIRYRFKAKEKFFFTPTRDFYLSMTGDVLSDATFVRDFFPNDYRLLRQPDNHIEITKRFPQAQASLLVRPQLNPFFETVERLPEIRFDIPRQSILSIPSLYYSGQSSLTRLQRKFANNDNQLRPFGNYNATRLDTYHQFSTPIRVFNPVQLVASVGWRGTYYDDSLPRYREILLSERKFRFRDNVRTLDDDTQIQFRQIPDSGGGAVWRSLFDFNLEGSVKLHRIYDYSKPRWGIEKLRHVVEPWFQFSYIPEPKTSTEAQIMLFDQRFGSTRLNPLTFPQYNSIDDISERFTLRLGLDHRFQTYRDGQNQNLLTLSTYIDVDPLQKSYPQTTSNLFNELSFQPVPWLRVDFLASTDVHTGGYHEYNTSLQWQITQPMVLRLTHRFLNNSDFFRDSNQLSAQWFVRINENWAFSTSHTFEFSETQQRISNFLRSQEYTLHRDLSSWRATLSMRWDYNTASQDEFSIFLSFTLKAFPEVVIPIGISSTQSTSGGLRTSTR